MNNNYNKEILELILSTIEELKKFLLSLYETGVSKIVKKSKLISYWIKDWIRYLSYEDDFKTKKHRKYDRGSVIKVNLGFNVGNELGGPHYAIVIDKNDSIKKPDIAIVPLTSIKETTDLNKLGIYRYNIENVIYNAVSDKLKNQLNDLSDILDTINDNPSLFNDTVEKARLLKKQYKELSKMKIGSIVHLTQLKTISKLRIISPTDSNDLLSHIKVTSEILDEIDKRIIRIYTNT